MTLEELKKEYDKLQPIYGDENLDSIYFGGKDNNPDICFEFMNPTRRNIASSKTWKGLKSPWIGTKNIWKLFYQLELLDKEIYDKIKSSDKNWSEAFAKKVYDSVKSHNYFITNLGKCTQLDARVLKDNVYKNYLELLKKN